MIDLSVFELMKSMIFQPPVLLGIAFLFVAAFFKNSWVKGWLGETAVTWVMGFLLPGEQYKVFDDLTLPSDRGDTQIDHVVVSPYGVFVVETKNMAGWIFGQERQMNWTQTFGRKKIRFQNPLHQNYKHVQAVKSLCGADSGPVHSIVVFVGGAKLKTDMPDNVTRGGLGLVRYIRAFKERSLSDDEIKRIIRLLEANR